MAREDHTGFRDRPVQPLWHPSAVGDGAQTIQPPAQCQTSGATGTIGDRLLRDNQTALVPVAKCGYRVVNHQQGNGHIMNKPADNQYPIHELLRQRWSPRAFDSRPVEPDKLRSLFEAARWAASSFNEQPWRFIVATRDQRADFDRLLGCLMDMNQAWAKDAPVLAITAAKQFFDHNKKPNRVAIHDLGLAVANLTVQATAMGLVLHQMGGIHLDAARDRLSIPAGFDPVTAIAIGYPGDPSRLPEPLRERELEPRERAPQSAFVFGGGWQQPVGWK